MPLFAIAKSISIAINDTENGNKWIAINDISFAIIAIVMQFQLQLLQFQLQFWLQYIAIWYDENCNAKRH